MIKTQLLGGAELRRRLMGMEASVSADILAPIIHNGAMDLRAAMVTRAPRRTGALAGGIEVEDVKAGKGFAYSMVAPSSEQYYGVFQEFGLGTGRSAPLQEKTLRRRDNFENSIKVKRQIGAAIAGGSSFAAELKGVGKREARRQQKLAKGEYVQGERRPNMAAQPFMRPSITLRWPYVRQDIVERLRELIERWQVTK